MPAITNSAPNKIDSQVGRASHKYSPVKAKPTGTRIRRAILCQVTEYPLGTQVSQQLPRCGNNFADRDFQNSFVGLRPPLVRCEAQGASQNNFSPGEWAIASRICRTKNCHDGNAQSRRQMYWPGVARSEERRV